jgi:hypothetical protein
LEEETVNEYPNGTANTALSTTRSSRTSIRKVSQGSYFEPGTNLRLLHSINTSEEGKNQIASLVRASIRAAKVKKLKEAVGAGQL